MMLFYVGIFQPKHATKVPRAFVSINRLRDRSRVPSSDWILDSGAFREIEQFGGYRHGPEAYARDIKRIAAVNPGLRVAVAQDFMCESFMLDRTGLSIAEHQRLTIERFDALRQLVTSVPVLPVLQGFAPADYAVHLDQYGDRLGSGAYVGVGSMCRRNGSPAEVEAVLRAIKMRRPDLRLHGFGLKTTSLANALVRDALYSADSMAWSFAARRQGRNGNDPAEGAAFAEAIERQPVQEAWPF
jgi:hypothetical protein